MEGYKHIQEVTRIYCNAACNKALYLSPMDTIAKRIARARERQGLNQSELARKLDISPQAVQNWEAGKSSPRGARIREVASILQISVDHLLFGEDKAGVITARARFDNADLPQQLESLIADLTAEIKEAAKSGVIGVEEINAIRALVVAKKRTSAG